MNHAATVTTVGSNHNPSVYRDYVGFTATVTAGATGNVTFMDGTSTLGSCPISNAQAGLSTYTLSAGSHLITAVYEGDLYHDGSTSSVLTQIVNQTQSSISVSSTLNPSLYQDSVTFWASVYPNPGQTGQVTFFDGTMVLGVADLSSGPGMYNNVPFVTSDLSVGEHNITAVYSGDANYLGSTSAVWTQTVSPAVTTTTLAIPTGPIVFGQPANMTAKVSTGVCTPTGVVQFQVDGSNYGNPVNLVQGIATLSVSQIWAGTHQISAFYLGDSANLAASADTVGVISTVAGDGNSGFSGDGVAATSTALWHPQGVAVDSSGNLYIADTYNNRIREVLKDSGTIITVAGNGGTGFGGDGAAATDANITSPRAIAIDSAGNLFIADAYNRVREILKDSGTIITVAGNGGAGFGGDGGAATDANLNDVTGIAVDTAGNLFIADSSNNRVREVLKDSGTIITVVGNGDWGYSGDGGSATDAQISPPHSVAVDRSGNLFIASPFNHAIREVVKATGQIITVAGNGLYGSQGDGGPATSAMLQFPYSVAVDDAGNIYIADNDSARIRKVFASTGVITTVAGNGNYGTTGDGGQATDATFNAPAAIGLDGSGNLFIADVNVIRMVSAGQHLTIDSAIAATRISTSSSSVKYGDSVTFTATVSADAPSAATPSGGLVQFVVDGVNYKDVVTLVNGVATLDSSDLSVGSHSVTAVYAGDGLNFQGSTAPAITQTVNKLASTTTLASSANPSTYGNSVTFTATVPAGATGTVTFKDGVSTLGTGIISGTTATFSTATLTGGSHSVTAVYGGDTNYATSTSSVLTQTMAAAPVVTASPNSVSVNSGATATFTAAAIGNPVPTVQWQISTTNGISWANITGATNTSYTTTAITLANDGSQYRAAFTNSLGSAITSTATLRLNQAPAITSQPLNVTMNTGRIATFTVTASGFPVPSVQWQVLGTAIGSTWTDIPGATSTSYSTLASGNSGNKFRAVFTNTFGTATTNAATLTIGVVATVTGTSVGWGTQTANLFDAGNGRLLPRDTSTGNLRAIDIPWLGIKTITLTLDQSIASLAAGDITLKSAGGFIYSVTSVTGSGTTLTINLGGPGFVNADKVNVTVGNSSLASYSRRLDVLPGDVNDDGLVSALDQLLVSRQLTASYIVFYDIDGNGSLTSNDVSLIKTRIGNKLPG